ncbi:MAG: hypothetical protein ABI696_15315 [Rubrivivax sp.]
MKKTLRALALALAAAGSVGLIHAQGLRPEVGKPLQQAGELLKAGKAREALAKVREAEAVSGKTGAEQLTVDRMKAAAAQRAGDGATAVQALNAIYGRVSGAEQAQTAEALAFAYSQSKDWAKAGEWANRAQQAGRDSAQLRQLQQYLLSQSGDYNAIARDAAGDVAAAEKAGRKPDEGDLLRLADAQQRLNQMGPYIQTLEKLLANHPKKDYWSAYLGRLPRKSGFSSRLGLDLMRLRLATGTLEKTDEYFEMAQLSLQAGLPAEGLQIIDKGYASGALGTGPQADRHLRLKELAVKRLAESKASLAKDAAEAARAASGDALVDVGYAYVTLGEVERGVKMIEQGIAKGNLKRPEDAKLRLGMAQLRSPALKTKGLQTLRSIKGSDGVAEIGRLWAVLGHA